MSAEFNKEIKLEVLKMAYNIANTQWLESVAKSKYEAEKNNAKTYEIVEDIRGARAINVARKLLRFIEATSTEHDSLTGLQVFSLSAN